jgi:hypothetical protein
MDESKELEDELKRVRTRTYDAFDGPLQVENQELTAMQE